MVSIPQDEVGRPGFRVIWTRGAGCMELAELLAGDEPVRVSGDLHEACLEARADLCVARRFSSFDLASVAVPHEFDPEVPDRVVALVGTGPHSQLAGQVAAAVGIGLGIPASLATAYRVDEDRGQAAGALQAVSAAVGLSGELVAAERASQLARHFGAATLLVLGAAGGWLLQRNLYGPGVRLKARAAAGAVVVRAAPARVYQRMVEPTFVSPHLGVEDAARLVDFPIAAVVDEGRLVGVVRRSALAQAASDMTVDDVMGVPTSVRLDDPMAALDRASEMLNGGPIPVTDREDRLIGSVFP